MAPLDAGRYCGLLSFPRPSPRFPRSAEAQQTVRSTTVGVGLFVGYTFGPRQGVEWGLEGFVSGVSEVGFCTNPPRSGIGGLGQIALIGLRDPRITIAAQGGKELERDGASFSGEFGLTYRMGSDPGPGIHLGLSPAFGIFNVFARGELLLDDYTFGGGIRVPTPYGGGFSSISCIVGRPLRTHDGLAAIVAHGQRSLDTTRASMAQARGSRRERAGRAWERDAQYECASVPAFIDLAQALVACGAPLYLVDKALDAAQDEIVHARISAQLASRYLGDTICPTLPLLSPRAPVAAKQGLLRLAVESWIDGCLGEGAAAGQAARARELALAPVARIVLERIEADEARHAELGWQILRWATQSGGTDARDAVRSLRDAEPSPAWIMESGDDGAAYGRLSAAQINAVTERNQTVSQRRLDGLLSDRAHEGRVSRA